MGGGIVYAYSKRYGIGYGGKGGGAPALYPQQLFDAGDTGFWVKADEAATLWQDGAGTIPAAPGDLVGRMSDKSGDGNHLTTINAARAQLRSIGGKQFLHLNTNQFYDLPGLTFDRRNLTMFWVGIVNRLAPTGAMFHSPAGATVNGFYVNGTGGEQRHNLASFAGAANVSTLGISSGLAAFAVVMRSGERKFFHGVESQALAAGTAGTSAGGYMGQWNGGTFDLTGLFSENILIQRAMTDPEILQMLDYLETQHKITSRATDRFGLFEGDSITQGVGAETVTANDITEIWQSYPAQWARLYGVQPKFSNFGTGGESVQNMALVGNTNAINAELAKNAWASKRFLVQTGGTNDLFSLGRSAVQLQGDMTTWAAAITPGIKKFVATLLPRTAGGAAEVQRQAYNTWLRANFATIGFDALVDNDADPRFANPADTNVLRDGTHPTTLGYSYKAQNLKAVCDAQGV